VVGGDKNDETIRLAYQARERIEQFLPNLDKDLQVDVDTTMKLSQNPDVLGFMVRQPHHEREKSVGTELGEGRN
jgi:hypothetical protein